MSENNSTVEEQNNFDNVSESIEEEITTLSSASLETVEISSINSRIDDSESVTDSAVTTNMPSDEKTDKIDDGFSNELE